MRQFAPSPGRRGADLRCARRVLRVSGKPTPSKMNAFDRVEGRRPRLNPGDQPCWPRMSLWSGVVAFSLLIGLQFVVTWSSVRARRVRWLVTGEPLMLLSCGEFLSAALRQVRVTEDEIPAAVRSVGIDSLNQVRAVVLETDSSFSVDRPGEGGNGSSLIGVDGPQKFWEPTERQSVSQVSAARSWSRLSGKNEPRDTCRRAPASRPWACLSMGWATGPPRVPAKRRATSLNVWSCAGTISGWPAAAPRRSARR